MTAFFINHHYPPTSDKLKRCAGCSLFQYCDKACQLTDWKSYHKHGECEFYRKLAACPDKEAANHFLGCHYGPILLRLYLIVKANPAVMLKKYQLHNGKERCLKDLMDNEHDEDESGINPEKLRMTCTAMLDIDDKLFAPPDFDLIKSLFHKLRINSFSIDHMEESGKSIALYIQTSVFDHSCRSNAAFVFIGKRMQIRAMKDIQEGEEVTIHYVDIMETKKERRDKLWKDWGFLCRCFRCEEHESEEERMELAAYKHYLNSFSTQPNVNMSSEQEQISDLFTRSMTFLPIREKYLGHYHPELTYSMFLAASAKSSQPDMSPQEKQELAALINKVESAAIITHGKEHEFYFMISILRATTCLLF